MTKRVSAIQKEAIKVLVFMLVKKGIREIKSTDLNQAIDKSLSGAVHPNNFRPSMKTLEDRELIVRVKRDLDWYIMLTESGFDMGFKWLAD